MRPELQQDLFRNTGHCITAIALLDITSQVLNRLRDPVLNLGSRKKGVVGVPCESTIEPPGSQSHIGRSLVETHRKTEVGE